MAIDFAVVTDETISLQEAAEKYDTSQATLYRFLADGRLTRHKRDGDKRTYLLRTELDRRLTPRPVPRPEG